MLEQQTTLAFKASKKALASAKLLSYQKPDALPSIVCDALDTTIGAVLQQSNEGQWCMISYFSKQLHTGQKQYSTFDRELLAIYQAIMHFQHFAEGRQFMIFTDHKPLSHALLASSDRHTPRQVQHLDYISQFASDIRHVKGTQNRQADELSFLNANALATDLSHTIDIVETATAQTDDPDLQRL